MVQLQVQGGSREREENREGEKVTQDRTMRDAAMKMQHEMMGHMMEHMQAGKDSMASCPMMKQMGGMK